VPENAFKKLKQMILPEWKVCFFSAFVFGLIAHLYKITSWLPNWDSLVFRYDAQHMAPLGRWLLHAACAGSSYYDLPLINGLISIFFHSLGAVCICSILKMKKNITAFLTGAFIASFPTVTSVMMYNYVADGYAVSFFLACLAAVFLTKEKPNWVLSAVLITLSMGIYQAYVTVTIMLLILWLIDNLIWKRKEALYIVKKSIGFSLTGLSGMLLYFGVLKSVLKLSGKELLSYQGLDRAASMSEIDIMASVCKIKDTFLNYFFPLSNGINLFVLLNIIAFVVITFVYLKYAVKNKVLSSVSKTAMLIVLCVFLMIGGNVLAFIDPGIDYHNLMLMGYLVFYMFLIVLYERGEEKSALIRCWAVFILSMAMILNNTVIANISYHKAQMAYEKSFATLIRIADRIENTPEAESCDEILVVGYLKDSESYSVSLPPDITGITDGQIIRADDETVGQSVFCSALNDYCGKSYSFLSGERKKELLEKAEVKNMKAWPLKDCVAVVDNIIVVKLGESG